MYVVIYCCSNGKVAVTIDTMVAVIVAAIIVKVVRGFSFEFQFSYACMKVRIYVYVNIFISTLFPCTISTHICTFANGDF